MFKAVSNKTAGDPANETSGGYFNMADFNKDMQRNSPYDDTTAAFYRKSEAYDDLLIVMNLSAQETKKDLSLAGKGLELQAVLTTGEEGVFWQESTLRLPAYSIVIFRLK